MGLSVLWFLLALAALALVLTLVIVLSWALMRYFYLPLLDPTYAVYSVLIQMQLLNLGFLVATAFYLVPATITNALLSTVATLNSNIKFIFFMAIVSSTSLVWLNYHPDLVGNYLVFRQCITRPPIDLFLLPVFGNIVRTIYNAGIASWNLYVNLNAFYEFGLPVILFKCAIQTDLTNGLYYFTEVFSVSFHDFVTWIEGDFLHNEWNIEDSLYVFGLFIDSLQPVLNCFCQLVAFLWQQFAITFQLPSFESMTNAFWNVIIRAFQVPIVTITAPHHEPDLTNVTLTTCVAIESFGNFLEDELYLWAQIFWGIFTNTQLPLSFHTFLSVPYASILSHPLCGGVKLINVTLIALVNYDRVTAPDGSGVGYFQFGFIFDEFKVAADALGDVFGALFNTDAQALVSQALLVVIDFVAFLFEWIVGNVLYFFYGCGLPASFPNAPCKSEANFFRYYFVDYWYKAIPLGVPVTIGNYTYSSSLSQMFTDIFLADQALANLIGEFNDPLGQMVQYALNAAASLLKYVANFVSYLYCIVTFNCDDLPITFRDVDIDTFFNQLYYFSAAFGDLFRQFDPTNCAVNPVTEEDKNFICSLGAFFTATIDTYVLATQQIVHFGQDILSLPAHQIHICLFGLYNATNRSQCVRFPNLAEALVELNIAICDLSYTIAGVIPPLNSLTCRFPPQPTTEPSEEPPAAYPCAHLSTCTGAEICAILQLFPLPITILNAFITKTFSGSAFTGFEEFLEFTATLLFTQLGTVINNFGLMIDCAFCAFISHASPNCNPDVYNILKDLSKLLRKASKIFTTLLIDFAKLFLQLVASLFGGGNPIAGLVQFIVGVLVDIFGGLGASVVQLLVSLFDAVGLSFVGNFINLLWKGFCPILQLVVNIIVVILKALTFGTVPLNFVNFCCNGGQCTPSGGNKRSFFEAAQAAANGTLDEETPLIDGQLFVNFDNWLPLVTRYHQWSPDDVCNATIQKFRLIPWPQLGDYEKGETLYCFLKLGWNVHALNQTFIGNSTCDAMILENSDNSWQQMSIMEKRVLMECMNDWLYTMAFRMGTNLTWLPQDILTNSYRKYYFGFEMMRGGIIYWQFFNDQRKPSATILSEAYQQQWSALNLNTEMYEGLETPEDVVAMREKYRMADYFTLNNATQYEAVLDISTGVWSVANSIVSSLVNVTLAMSDNVTNPAVYLSYNYTLDNGIAASSSALLGTVGNLLKGLRDLTEYWSDPVNYKRRSDLYEKLSLSMSGMRKAAENQVRLMTTEFLRYKIKESTIYAQQCEVDGSGTCTMDDEREMAEHYEDAYYGRDFYEGQTSLVYKLSKWYENVMSDEGVLRVYPIKNPRYGTNRSTYNRSGALLQYTDAYGQLQNETLRQRFWRYWALASGGSKGAQRRGDTFWMVVGRFKERLGMRLVEYNLRWLERYREREPDLGDDERMEMASVVQQYEELEHYAHLFYAQDVKHFSKYAPRTKLQRERMATECRLVDGVKHCQVKRPLPSAQVTAPVVVRALYADPEQAALLSPFPQQDWQTVSDAFARSRSPMLRSPLTAKALYRIADFLTLTPQTNITFPCSIPLMCNGSNVTTLFQQCVYLDQLVGRVESALAQTIDYYLHGPFAAALNESYSFLFYSFDPNARVVVGSSPDLLVGGFPRAGGMWANMVYMDDNTPKIYFNDIVNETDAFFNGSNMSFYNSSLVQNIDYGTINGQILGLLVNTFAYPLELSYRIAVYFSNANRTSLEGSAGTTFIASRLTCDWETGDDFAGTVKRFSIGQMFVMFGGGYFVLSIGFYATYGVNFFSLVFGTSLSTFIWLVGFLIIYENYAITCFPGLPWIFFNDIFYFFAYNAFPKCSWFWGFLVNSEYTNDNCYSCINTQNFVMLDCNTLGFNDITGNLIFMVQFYFPDVLQWIRDTRSPIYILYQIPYINERINAFVNVNLADPRVYAQYMGCNYIVSLVPNGSIAALYFTLAAFLLPYISAVVVVGWLLVQIFYQTLLILYLIFIDLCILITTLPAFFLTGQGARQPGQQAVTYGAAYGRKEDDERKKKRARQEPDQLFIEEENKRGMIASLVNMLSRWRQRYSFVRKDK